MRCTRGRPVHLVEVPASQAEHLKAWLGNRVKTTLVIPDFHDAGLTFAGGRLVVLDGEPVAELMYTRAKGPPIAFYVLAHAGEPSTLVVERRGDLNLATWDDGSHAYVVVGDAEPADDPGARGPGERQLSGAMAKRRVVRVGTPLRAGGPSPGPGLAVLPACPRGLPTREPASAARHTTPRSVQ